MEWMKFINFNHRIYESSIEDWDILYCARYTRTESKNETCNMLKRYEFFKLKIKNSYCFRFKIEINAQVIRQP